MRIRRFFIFFLCLCLGAALLGCSKQQDPEIMVGICIADSALPIHTAAKDALMAQFHTASVSEAKGDAALQLRQAEVYLQEGYSLLVAEPTDAQTALALAELSKQHETPIIFTDYSADQTIAQPAYRGSHIGCAPSLAGPAVTELLALLPNGGDTNQDGEVAYLLVTDTSADAFQTTLVQSCMDAMADAQLLRTITCDGTSQSAQELCDQALADYGRDIEVILTTGADIALGVTEAIRDRGWYPGTDNYVLAVSKQNCSEILKEGVSGIIIPDAEAYGTLITQLALEQLQENPSITQVLVPWQSVR